MSALDAVQYVNADGLKQGAYVGTALDEVLASSLDWRLVIDESAPVEPEEVVEDDPTDEDEVAEVVSVDADDYSRDELNELARELGIEDAEALATKADVAEAINNPA